MAIMKHLNLHPLLLITLCFARIPKENQWMGRKQSERRTFEETNSLRPVKSQPKIPLNGEAEWDDSSLFSNVDSRSLCNSFAALSKEQREICYKFPDLVATAQTGIRTAVYECHEQFRKNRWNCSSLAPESRSIYSNNIFKKGYRESAFATAITAAGIQYSVAKACTLSKSKYCGCREKQDPDIRRSWEWKGCSDYIRFAARFTKLFLDSLEHGNDFYSFSKLHNNKAGRLAVSKMSSVRCKCHGMSGSCEVKTCWKAVPVFRKIGNYLKKKYYWAKLIDPINDSRDQRFSQLSGKKQQKSKLGDKELVYYEKSPNFCDPNPLINSQGTTGRICNKSSTDSDSCSSMCCGRGYSTVRQLKQERCGCRFHWCCQVVCDTCISEQWVTVCK